MRQVGCSSHGGFKYLTLEQYDRLSKHKSIVNISYSVPMAVAENKELEKRPTEIRYTNGMDNAKGMFSMPTTGRLPENEDECATDTLVLKYLGIEAKIGEKVTLEYSIGNTKKSAVFTLVGFWDGDTIIPASMLWLDKSFVENELENYTPTYLGDMIGTIFHTQLQISSI